MMNVNTLIWTASFFILNCGCVFTYLTSGIESNSNDHLLRTENEIENSVDLDMLNLPVKDDNSVELDNNVISLEDYIRSRDNLHRKIESNLLELTKRSWRAPFFIRSFQPTKPNLSSMNRRRSQPLSVTGPLSSLANMLAAEGRRRQQSESINNRMRLLELGKRRDDYFKPIPESEMSDSDSDLKSLPFVYR